jgi:hypothetical protein
MDYLAGIILLVSYFLTGKKKWYGWIFSWVGNLLWVYIGIRVGLNGLWVISLIMAVIGFINMIKWFRINSHPVN